MIRLPIVVLATVALCGPALAQCNPSIAGSCAASDPALLGQQQMQENRAIQQQQLMNQNQQLQDIQRQNTQRYEQQQQQQLLQSR
jgi:hypothetical protein